MSEFDKLYHSIIDRLLVSEAEGDEAQPEQQNDGNDVLDAEQESQLETDEDQGDDESTQKLILLTNILLNSLRFKPTKEFKAYINMPRFHNLKLHKKLAIIRNAIVDHPERLFKEAEGDEPVEEFGDEEIKGLTENEEADILRLIIRAMNINPLSMDVTLKELPMKADNNNYVEIIDTVEDILF